MIRSRSRLSANPVQRRAGKQQSRLAVPIRSFALALSLASLLIFSLSVSAQEPLQFETAEQQRRFEALTVELRCLVCQNQSLADSDAPLAHDLRAEVHQMILAGQDDAAIKRFLVDRYGDFVLYRPPVRGNTLALWLAPAILLAIGAAVLGYQLRRRQALLEADEEDPENPDMGP